MPDELNPIEKTCALDQRCSCYADGLAMDTSHVCVLARTSKAMTVAGKAMTVAGRAVGDKFRSLLDAHACEGQHILFTSRTLCEDEMDMASPDAKPRLFADLPVNALEDIACVDGEHLASSEFESGRVGDRDLTLLRAADASVEEGTILILTDDEALHDLTMRRAVGTPDTDVAVLAQYSITFLGRLHRCGSMSFDTLIKAAEVESNYALDRWTGELRKRKLNRIRDTLNEAALHEPPTENS